MMASPPIGRCLQFQKVPHPAEQLNAAKATGDTLKQDIQTALDPGSNYVLIYARDIDDPANQQTLQWAASLVSA